MTKLEIIRQWMAEGKILHPLEKTPNIVDVIRTLMTLCGYREFKETNWIKVLKRELLEDAKRRRASDRYVVVVIDGLGTNLRPLFPPGGFFDRAYLRDLRSVFPSTTACALTSLVSGQWPGVHGLTGWYTHLPEIGRTAKVFPFVDRFSDKPMEEYGAELADLIPVKSLLADLDREVCVIVPNDLRGGAYSAWAHRGTEVIGYRSLPGGFQAVAANVQNRPTRSITFFYIPDVDTAEHEGGSSCAKVRRLVRSLDEAMLKLKESVPNDTKIVVLGDHGLIDVPENRQVRFSDGHPMLRFLETPPSGEPAAPIFHVKAGMERRFEETITAAFGPSMELVSISDVEALGLFGPDRILPFTRRRFGTCVGIAHEPFVMIYDPPGKKPLNHLAFHGGLQPDVMSVPLFVL